MSSLYTIGQVLRAHGIRGLLRVRSAAENFADFPHVYVGDKKYPLVRATPDKEDFLIELAGLTDRTQAEALRGSKVAVERELLSTLDEDQVRVADLVGCAVFTNAGERLGEVVSSYFSGAQEILEVRRDGKERTFFLPFVDGIVTSWDLEAKRIVCDPPEGLLEINDENAVKDDGE